MSSYTLKKMLTSSARRLGSLRIQKTLRLPYPSYDVPLEDLLEMIACGSMDAFESLYMRMRDAVFGQALRITRCRDDADEIMQETFVSVWAKAHTFDRDKGVAAPWVMKIGRNQALKRIRISTPVQDNAEIEGIACQHPTPEMQSIKSSVEILMLQRLDEMPEELRDIIRMSYINGMTYEAISQATGQNVNTLKTKVRRGLARLRETLEK